MGFPWDFHFEDGMRQLLVNILVLLFILTISTSLFSQDSPDEKFNRLTNESSAHYFERYQLNKLGATMFYVFGVAAFSAGTGLFIHDKVGGENSLTAQYTLLLGGLTLLSSATILNLRSERFLETSSANSNLLKNQNIKKLAKTYRKHGIAMLSLSIPMIAVAIYGFVDTRKYIESKYANEDSGDSVSRSIELEKGMAYIFQGLTFAPAVFTLAGGIIMLVKASRYEKIKTDQTDITLKSISPMINPVTKTYGISMGFSF